LPKLPRLTAEEAERKSYKAGFRLIRSKGSQRLYIGEGRRIILPFHAGKTLHPKIIKQLFEAIAAQT